MEVCRVCLDLLHDHNFDLLDGVLKDMVSLLVPEIDMEISDKPNICKTCSAPLEELFNFKSNFLRNEDKLEGKIDKHKDTLDLREVLRGSDANTDQIKAKEKFCRTCLELIDCDRFTMLDPLQPDIYLSCMLNMCLPEMDLKLTKNPLMCESCLENIQKLHHLKSNCLETEKKLNSYCNLHGTNSSGQINLATVLDSEIVKKLDNNMLNNIVLPEIDATDFLAVDVKTEVDKIQNNGFELIKTGTSHGTSSNGNGNLKKAKCGEGREVDTSNLENSRKIEEVTIKKEISDETEMKEEDIEEDKNLQNIYLWKAQHRKTNGNKI